MSRRELPPTACVVFLLATAVSGCGPSQPARIPAPALDPAAVATAAAANGDLDKLPAIAFARSALDADKDKKVSQSELVKWLEEVRDSKVAITSVAVQVLHKGKPLSGAEIRLVPEACMAGGIKEASGTTDQSGMSMVTIPGSEFAGVNCGLYRVEITGNGNDGKPLPAKYNSQSTLGVAVGGILPEQGMASFELD